MNNTSLLSCQKEDFSLPEDLTYLNCAYMSPLAKSVADVGKRGIDNKVNPTLVRPSDFFEESDQLRRAFAQLVHAEDPQRVVIIPSVSYGIATVARNITLQQGEEIIVTGEQFPSNYYTWEKLAQDSGALVEVVEAPEGEEGRGKRWNEALLEAIGPRTKVVALGHVHWADGTLFWLTELRRRSREVGALLIIDGTQSVGALPFDIAEIQPDALICGGYKWLLGPYSLGMAYYGAAFDDGIPLEENWINRQGSEDFAGLVRYEDRYLPGSLRYEVGEHSNFILVPMLLEALRKLNLWGVGNIQNYCKALTTEPIAELRRRGYFIEEGAYRGHHLFGIRLPRSRSMEDIRKKLMDGNVHASIRGKALRISVNVYNDTSDMAALVDALR